METEVTGIPCGCGGFGPRNRAIPLWEVKEALMRHSCWAGIALLTALLLPLLIPLSVQAAPFSQDLPPDHPPVESGVPDRPSASQGISVYAASCAPCHGETGRGDGPSASGLPNPPTAFTDPDPLRTLSPQAVFDVIKNGRLERGMPPWKNRLSDEAIWSVTAYLFDLNLGEEGYTAARALYEARCASCHGPRGKGGGPRAEDLTMPDFTHWPDWTNVSNREWLNTIITDSAHADVVASLSREELDAALAYVRSLTYSSSLAPFRGDGVLEGRVEMLTQGEETNFEGLPITLFGFRGSMEPQLTLTTTVSANGTFRFTNLSTEPDALYTVSTDWEGAVYSSGVIGFPPGGSVITATLRVAATTDQDPGLKAARVHWFIDFEGDSLIVGELLSISNPGDRAYIGQPLAGHEGKRAVIRWPVPNGATNLQVDGGQLGDRFFFEDGVLIDTLPVPPGNDVRRLLFQYRLPIERDRVTFAHPVGMPVTFLNVFIADRGEKIEAPSRMITGTPQEVSGVSFRSFIASNIEAGETLTFKFSNISAAVRGGSPHIAPSSRVRQVGIALAVLVGLSLFGGTFYLTRRRASVDTATVLRRRRDALLEEIALLDTRFQEGEVDEATYHEERDLLMAEAVRLTMLLGEDA